MMSGLENHSRTFKRWPSSQHLPCWHPMLLLSPTGMQVFPHDWPPQCPPADADDAEGEVFRIIVGEVVVEDDLKSYKELDKPASGSPCRRCAVSVFTSAEHARHRMELSPSLGTNIASGTLRPEHGKMKLTSKDSGHIAWWPASGVNRVVLFAPRRGT